MQPLDPSDGRAPHPATIDEKAEAAELSAKVLALPHRKTVPREESKSGREHHGGAPLPRRRWRWWFGYLLVWSVTLSLGVAVILRIFYYDATVYLTWINAFTRYVYLPAYLCLAWAVWMRRWVLALAGVAIVACHFVWVIPDFVRDRRFDMSASEVASASPSPLLRIFFANVLATNSNYGPIWNEIAEADPDVIVLAECTPGCLRSLRNMPFMRPYLEANPHLRSQQGEVVVYSKLPINSERQHWAAHRVLQNVELQIGSKSFRLIGLHAPRPVYSAGYDYFGYYKQVVPFLTSQHGPLLVIGDFNATQYSLVYQRLQASGLRSAHEDRGRGWATTWSNGRWPVPPIRIDHAFLSPELECERIAEGRGSGSDHKPLIMDVRLRDL